ncbi:MAG: MFS transporter [Solirubrobacterales bacterium]|nr:MFS transporter [Solirubrobacterales bacterium]
MSNTVTSSPPAARERRQGVNPWLVLVIACLAQFMVVLDISVVNIALPRIQNGLHFSASDLQWVVNAYTLVFGGFLLLGGRAADLLGRRRLFIAGVVLFSAASLFNGLAQSSGMLIVGRGLQGLGGALVSPAALSIVTTTFTDGDQRTRALGVWSAIAAGGAAAGLLLGGVLTDVASWRWVFFINVPVGIATVALALRYVVESRLQGVRRSYDVAGAVTVTVGLVVLVYAIVKAQSFGWGSARTLGLGAAAVVLLGAFLWIESRSEAPLMRLGIFRVRSLAVGDTSLLLVASGMFGMFFFASLYVQDILHYSPLKAGLAFLPVTAGIILGSGIAQGIIKRLGVRNVAAFGITVATIGMLILTRVPVHGSYVSNLLVGLIPLSLGLGLTFVPVTLLGTSGVAREDSGLASGLFNTAQQVGGSLGLAILSTIAASHTSSILRAAGASVTAAQAAQARVSGYQDAFLAAAIMLAVGAVLLAVGLRRRHMREIEAELAATDGVTVAAA